MKKLSRSDELQVSAAEGWLMLGNPLEAHEELERVSERSRYHPAVLSARWQVFAAAGWWESAMVVSRTLCAVAPDQPCSWICQANALRRREEVAEACELLVSVVNRFPGDPIIAYNLACFTCQLGQLNEACNWLLQAFDHEESTQLKILALADPDLKPLWDRINSPPVASVEIGR